MDSLQEINSSLEKSYKNLPLVSKPEDIVPGEGQDDAVIMMIGEAPGREEAIQRRPFDKTSASLIFPVKMYRLRRQSRFGARCHSK